MKQLMLCAGGLSLLSIFGFMGVAHGQPEVSTSQTERLQPLTQKEMNEDFFAQVTSVSQLSDIDPTDWAFQALTSLVQRYGCVAGYPDGTFRGNRAVTRNEMAALLSACLDSISDRLVSAEDLKTIQALQTAFKAELTPLSGRVDALAARAAALEAQQFSTTSKLSGKAVFMVQYGDTARDGFINPETQASVPQGSARASVIAVAKLDFNTSFNGTDLLQTSIAAGNSGEDLGVGLGLTNYPNTSGNAGQPYFISRGINGLALYSSDAFLYRLAYTFKPTENLALTVGPQVYPSDFLDFNSYANNAYSDFGSYVFSNNPLIVPFALNFLGGAGASLDWKVKGRPVSLRAAYVAARASNAIANENGGGLFGDPYQATAEVEYADTFGSKDQNNFAVRLQYTNAATFDVAQNAVGLNVEISVGQFGLFGRYGYSAASAFGTATAPLGTLDFTAQTWMAGVGVKDLLVPGSLAAIAVGQPFINNLPATNAFGANNATQTNYEAFFRLPVNDNISVTPGVMVITDANNTRGQPTLIQGYVRTTFSF